MERISDRSPKAGSQEGAILYPEDLCCPTSSQSQSVPKGETSLADPLGAERVSLYRSCAVTWVPVPFFSPRESQFDFHLFLKLHLLPEDFACPAGRS